MSRLIMQLTNDEECAICDTERSPQLQQHTAADGMNEYVIGGPFLFELMGGEQVVFESNCTVGGGAILTHDEARTILTEAGL